MMAYTLGLQYIETVLLEIPKHGYYYANQHCTQRLQSSIHAAHVGHLLYNLLLVASSSSSNDNDYDDNAAPSSTDHRDDTSTTTTMSNLRHLQPSSNTNHEPSIKTEPSSSRQLPTEDMDHIQHLITLAMEQIEQASSDQQQYPPPPHDAVRSQPIWNHHGDKNYPSTTDWNVCGEPMFLACCGGGANKSNIINSNNLSSNDAPGIPPRTTTATPITTRTNSLLRTLQLQEEQLQLYKDKTTTTTQQDDTSTTTRGSDKLPSPDYLRRQKSLLRTIQMQETLLQSYSKPSQGTTSIARESDPCPSYESLPSPLPPPSRSVHSSHDHSSIRTRPSTDSTVRSTTTPFGLVRQNTSSSVTSYQSTEEKLLLEKALFLSGLDVSTTSPLVGLPNSTTMDHDTTAETSIEQQASLLFLSPPPPPPLHARSSAVLELATLAQLYHEDFDSLQQSGRVMIRYADTYQGRQSESTNGCTVIAPLLCIHHLITPVHEYNTTNNNSTANLNDSLPPMSDPGLSDESIVMVIDKEAPVILSELRQTLGLARHAFLIPADAHDYLLEQGQLSSNQFITVTGGNILHDDHLNSFVSILESHPDRKIGATLFFHEHVVSILKLQQVDRTTGAYTRSWYDIIDSLPNPETLRRCNESTNDLYHRIGIFASSNIEQHTLNHTVPKTARIRCCDGAALGAVLKWYACSKFTTENMSYIDQYAWDEQTCDFDPRVFQAFIWGSSM
jgi:hypothetical protein